MRVPSLRLERRAAVGALEKRFGSEHTAQVARPRPERAARLSAERARRLFAPLKVLAPCSLPILPRRNLLRPTIVLAATTGAMPPTNSVLHFRDASRRHRRLLAAFQAMSTRASTEAFEAGGIDADDGRRDGRERARHATRCPSASRSTSAQRRGTTRADGVEEPSVVAAASNAAKLVRAGGGFAASVDEPLMTAQIQVTTSPIRAAAAARVRGGRGRAPRARRPRGARARRARRRRARARGARPRRRASWWRTCSSTAATRWARTWSTPSPRRSAPRVAELAGGELGPAHPLEPCDRRCVRVTRARARRARFGGDARPRARGRARHRRARRASPSSIPTAPPRTTRAS